MPYRAPTSRVHWLGVLAVTALGTLGPALVVDGRLGLPIFKGAEGVLMFLAFVTYCAVLVAFALLGVFFVLGRRIPAALFFGLAILPAGIGFFGWAKVLASREQVPDLNAEAASSMLHFVADIARPIAAFGLASSGCAFLVVVALAAERQLHLPHGRQLHRPILRRADRPSPWFARADHAAGEDDGRAGAGSPEQRHWA
jgi:hypothetical protein